jgi:hypothetical protein
MQSRKIEEELEAEEETFKDLISVAEVELEKCVVG